MLQIFDDSTKKDIKKTFGSSGVAVISCSPLELLKMNAQVTSSKIRIRSIVSDIYRTHGLGGFYKGLIASACAQPGYWTMYYPIYNNLIKRYEKGDGSIETKHQIGSIFVASSVASMVVNPLFVFKTRFQTAVLKKNNRGVLLYPKMSYKTLIRQIAKNEGIRGFYKGNMVAQIKNTQMVIQMPLYGWLRDHPHNPFPSSNILFIDRDFISGIIAKTIASCVIYYPIDCIRTNLRDNVQNKTLVRIVKDIYRRPGGFANFYRGVGIYWISAVPTFGMIMFLYRKF